jgi:hypothetical protein
MGRGCFKIGYLFDILAVLTELNTVADLSFLCCGQKNNYRK